MRRLLSALVAATMVFAVGVSPAWAQELVVDLAADSTTFDEHTARLAWHLTADNLDPANPSVSAAWYSKYLDDGAETDGRLVIDLEAGTVAGDLVQRWTCSGCLEGVDGEWITAETGWTASLADARIAPDGSGWRIDGTVTIQYYATAFDDESTPPSTATCGDGPCPNVCTEGVCHISEQSSSTVPLTGWIDGSTVSLAFEDGLLENVADMDVSGLADTQYFMSRFSMTVTATPQVEAAATETTAATESPTTAARGDDAAATAGETADAAAAEGATAEDQGADEQLPATAGEEETGEAPEAKEEAGAPNVVPGFAGGDGSSRTPLLVALTVALLLLVLLLLKGTLVGRPEPGEPLQTPAEVVGHVAADLVTDPGWLMEHAGEMTAIEEEAQQRAAKAAAGPQLESTGAPAGTVKITQSVEAVAGGASQTLPAGTSFPAGVTVDWYGTRWTPVKVGEKWWWVPRDHPGVIETIEVSDPHGTPERLSPPPYQVFRLSEPTLVTTTQGKIRLEPGDYQLGKRVVTADDAYYEVRTPKGSKIGTVKQSSLPKDSGLPAAEQPSTPSTSRAPRR